MTVLPKLQDVQESLKTAIVAALAAANAPGLGQVYIGWPVGSEEVQKLGQPVPEGSITIFPIRSSQNATRYPWEPTILSAPVVNLIVTVAQNVATFSGVSDQAYNIHGFLSGKTVDAYFATTASQALSSVATAFAAAINALSVPGITASASGDAVTLAGGQFQVVNIGSFGTFAIEEFRIRRTLQVTVWINDVNTRWLVVDAILTAIGSSTNHFLTLTDGTVAYIRYMSDVMDDSSSSSYSLYAHHLWYEVEYGQVQTGEAYEIEGIAVTQEIDNRTPSTTYHFGQT